MPSRGHWFKHIAPDGSVVTGVACTRSRRGRVPDCSVCTQEKGPILCDGPAPAGSKRKSCDAPLCRGCAHRTGPDRDMCPKHYGEGHR
jgi:hypothetical protein